MTATKTASQVATGNASDTLSRASLIGMGTVSGLIGLWAAACLVGALTSAGIGPVARGFISALFG